jgi:hypothetical protein
MFIDKHQKVLPKEEARQLKKEDSTCVSGKLAVVKVKARSEQLLHDIHVGACGQP